MARTLKSKGMEETQSLIKRINRQHKLGRISKKNWISLLARAREIEAIITEMTELNEHGEEEGVQEW